VVIYSWLQINRPHLNLRRSLTLFSLGASLNGRILRPRDHGSWCFVTVAVANVVLFSCALLILKCANTCTWACSINILSTKLTTNRNTLRAVASLILEIIDGWRKPGPGRGEDAHASKLDDQL
jgi:hypothetical protein